MRKKRSKALLTLAAALLAGLGSSRASAQEATVVTPQPGAPGSVRSTLGPTPGAGGNPFGMSPGTDPQFLGGRPGASTPRVPSSITMPAGGPQAPLPALTAPARLRITDVPLYGPLEIPSNSEEEGPADGLTLDSAMDRLLRANLDLAARRIQIPAARADVLTAGLRANPILYTDSQLVPYRAYNKDRSGGPTQYDLNITYPIDYSGKRLARKASAQSTVSVQEAEYLDAVRIVIDNLYTAFVDVLAARETVRYARASEIGLQRLLAIHEELFRRASLTRLEVNRVRNTLAASSLFVADAEATRERTKQILSRLLNLPPERAGAIEVRGTIGDLAPPPPAIEELRRIALASRPDLLAQRLGVSRALADVRLARANGFGDAYLLYQPYTFQDNAPVGSKGATSWALGATIPIPLFNRNQGGVLRSQLNTRQTRNEVAAREHAVAVEVHNAEREYRVTRDLIAAIERDLLPSAKQYRDDTLRLFIAGGEGTTAVETAAAQKDYNTVVRHYRDTLIRHRRSMLTLNTAVGRRVLP